VALDLENAYRSILLGALSDVSVAKK